jgi:hypothetical protein
MEYKILLLMLDKAEINYTVEEYETLKTIRIGDVCIDFWDDKLSTIYSLNYS